MNDPLSVESIRQAKEAELTKKLSSQASANVLRQQFAASQRQEQGIATGKGKKSSSAADSIPPSLKAAPAKKSALPAPTSNDDAKARNDERLKLAQIITGYFENPILSRKLGGIYPPANGASLEDLRACYEMINRRLNCGVSSTSLKKVWLTCLVHLDPHLEKLPGAASIPPGSSNYAAMRMQELDLEFEQLAVELSPYFGQGPWMRLLTGTATILGEYKWMAAQQQQQAAIAQEEGEEEEDPGFATQSQVDLEKGEGTFREEDVVREPVERKVGFDDSLFDVLDSSSKLATEIPVSSKVKSRKSRGAKTG